jgi:hypothetical protein
MSDAHPAEQHHASLEEAWYSQLREHWKPERVRLLLIAESAPDDGGDLANRRFFYSDRLTGHDSLFRGVVEAVLDVAYLDSQMETKARWLGELRDRGIFLIDLVPFPVNGPNKKKLRSTARRLNADGCVQRATALDPKGIIVCHKPSFRVLKAPLESAGLPLLHQYGISFPSGNWRADFVRDFRAAYDKIA